MSYGLDSLLMHAFDTCILGLRRCYLDQQATWWPQMQSRAWTCRWQACSLQHQLGKHKCKSVARYFGASCLLGEIIAWQPRWSWAHL